MVDYKASPAAESRGNTLWRTWWLLSSRQLIYAAYQCAVKNREEESDQIEEILQTLDASDGTSA